MSIGRWDPFWIEASSRRLYAALHPAAGRMRTGVVAVPPLLHEMPRSRRFLTEVASSLAAMGLPTLRFDFHGTGDSSGKAEQSDFESMHLDLGMVVEQLRERTGVSKVAFIAWRGAALVMESWIARASAELLVFWEPVTNGAEWLHELEESDARERKERPPARPGVPRTGMSPDGQLMGFPTSCEWRRDLAGATLFEKSPVDGVPRWLVTRTRTPGWCKGVARTWSLPENTPGFAGNAAMDATVFLTPGVRSLVEQMGRDIYEGNLQ